MESVFQLPEAADVAPIHFDGAAGRAGAPPQRPASTKYSIPPELTAPAARQNAPKLACQPAYRCWSRAGNLGRSHRHTRSRTAARRRRTSSIDRYGIRGRRAPGSGTLRRRLALRGRTNRAGPTGGLPSLVSARADGANASPAVNEAAARCRAEQPAAFQRLRKPASERRPAPGVFVSAVQTGRTSGQQRGVHRGTSAGGGPRGQARSTARTPARDPSQAVSRSTQSGKGRRGRTALMSPGSISDGIREFRKPPSPALTENAVKDSMEEAI